MYFPFTSRHFERKPEEKKKLCGRAGTKQFFNDNKRQILNAYPQKSITIHEDTRGEYVIVAHESREFQQKYIKGLPEKVRKDAFTYTEIPKDCRNDDGIAKFFGFKLP